MVYGYVKRFKNWKTLCFFDALPFGLCNQIPQKNLHKRNPRRYAAMYEKSLFRLWRLGALQIMFVLSFFCMHSGLKNAWKLPSKLPKIYISDKGDQK